MIFSNPIEGIERNKPRILTELAIDFRGKLMKRKKVNVENLPNDDPEQADVKMHGIKRLKSQGISREEYEKLINDTSNI